MLNGKVKARATDLAIFGDCPAFEEALYVGRPNVGDRRPFLRRVNAALDRRWLTNNGPFAREFEQRIQSRTCVEHAVAVCNATVGAVVTNNAALAQRVRQTRDFGFGADHEDVADVGTNGKMNEISAAMGLTLLDSMDDIIAANRQVYRRYLYGPAGIPGIRPIVYDECEENTHHYIYAIRNTQYAIRNTEYAIPNTQYPAPR